MLPKIILTPEQVAAVVATVMANKSSDMVDDSITYPYRDPDPRAQGHLFATREEHEAWKVAIKMRDAALDAEDARDKNLDYKGKLNPDILDRMDWAWKFQNQKRLPGDYDLFDRVPWIGDRSTGMLYHPGDLASAVDTSGYYPEGSKFGPYLL
jgi:hypothetical protein